jgi:hypothetical protein
VWLWISQGMTVSPIDRPPRPKPQAHAGRGADDTQSWTAAKDQLDRDGYALLNLGPDALALCDQVTLETDAMVSAKGVGRVQDAWRRSLAVRALATHPVVIDFLQEAYGREPFAFQTLNFRVGTQQEVHSDTVHFNAEPQGLMCGVWVALEDISPDSGPLLYYPGSHRLPRLTMADVGVKDRRGTPDDYIRLYVPALAAQLKAAGLQAQTATISKGQAFVWAANLAHGGSPITNPALTRRSMVTHYLFRNSLYYTPMMSDEPNDDLQVRLPQDVATGRFVWPRKGGRIVVPKPMRILRDIRSRMFRVVLAQ